MLNFCSFPLYAAPVLMAAGGILAFLFQANKKGASVCGSSGALLGAIAGIFALQPVVTNMDFFFRFPILLLTAAGALHSPGYLRGHGEERAGYYWLFFNLTAAAMWFVTISRTPLCFLIAWEVMGMASFALVAFDAAEEKIRRAAWIYLLACQAGALFLIMMFFLPLPPTAILVLGILGFGLKIGFPVLHIWLPEAHPAAPAPVSALMSGAMIQLGFFGIFAWVTPHMPSGCGMTLFVLGLTGALWGIMMALPQRNLKKLLAYSSVENMGILSAAFGFYILALEKGSLDTAALAIAGAQLHMLNHACLKGGLFLGAGSVLKGCHTLNIDRMGGLLKRMPQSGAFFILNACSLSGLPPFNGFISEFLIYLAGIYAVISGKPMLVISGGILLIVLALTGGIAAAVYAKAVGGVFLGEPRTEEAVRAEEVTPGMRAAVVFLFLCSIILTLLSPIIARFTPGAPEIFPILYRVVGLSLVLSVLFAGFAFFYFRNKARRGITWDCGYAKPDARMEYTGSAFSQPLSDLFAPLLNFRKKYTMDGSLFPQKGNFESSAEDPVLCGFWNRIFRQAGRLAEKVHAFQSGSLHLYILVMTLALILLLVRGLLLNGGF